MSMRRPIKLSTTFLVFFPNHLFLPECGWVSYCMEWEEYGQKFELGRDPFLKNVLWLPWQGKCPKTYAILPCIHVFPFFLTILLHVGAFGEQLEFFLCLSFHVFGCWLHFSHGWEVVLIVLGIGLSSSRFFGAADAFSIHVFGSFMCFYHGCEEPFTFFTVSATIGLTHRLFGAFFPCCELVSLISFRTVCFPPCCEPFLLLRMGLCNSFFPV